MSLIYDLKDMDLKKLLVFVFVLPLTLFFDLILYAFLGSCPSCGSFWQFLTTEGALSFPIVASFINWVNRNF